MKKLNFATRILMEYVNYLNRVYCRLGTGLGVVIVVSDADL